MTHNRMRMFWWVGVLGLVALAACSPATPAGQLVFRANGEDFAREGLVSKDGWAVTFDHVYVTLTDITAYQTDPPYDAHEGGELTAQAQVELPGQFTVDLVTGTADAPPLVGQVEKAPAGHYNAISFRVVPAEEGPSAPHAIVISGSAEKDGNTVAFSLNVDQAYAFTCGEYVGDARKGILSADGTADLEMTFHLDHIFGDASMPPDDGLNTSAVGFEPFAALAEDGVLEADLAMLADRLAPADYEHLSEALLSLAHVGEGHCDEQLD
ncbi:MAG: DUF4382 domain-containing protein [Anaerolineae bacterium]